MPNKIKFFSVKLQFLLKNKVKQKNKWVNKGQIAISTKEA